MTNTNTGNEMVVQTNVAESIVGQQGVSALRADVYIDANGKYRKKVQYAELCTVKADTMEEKIWLFNVLQGTVPVKEMRPNIGKQFTLQDVIFKPYESINEDTQEDEYGVTTTIITVDGDIYVTSSKTVYNTLKDAITIFGLPGNDGAIPMKLEIISVKHKNARNASVGVMVIA